MPSTDTAPSVPGGTGLKVVIRKVRLPRSCPISEPAVSAAAVAKAAAKARAKSVRVGRGGGKDRAPGDGTAGVGEGVLGPPPAALLLGQVRRLPCCGSRSWSAALPRTKKASSSRKPGQPRKAQIGGPDQQAADEAPETSPSRRREGDGGQPQVDRQADAEAACTKPLVGEERPSRPAQEQAEEHQRAAPGARRGCRRAPAACDSRSAARQRGHGAGHREGEDRARTRWRSGAPSTAATPPPPALPKTK